MMFDYFCEEDKLGMRVTSGSAKLSKDGQNLIGISIGGGAPHCPCLYIVQIFDSTPASQNGSLQAGDEITAVNGISVKGKTKVETARLIQSFKDDVVIFYNKLHADPKQGKTLDIVLKKVKHHMVESMQASTADALGLSRAILINDSMVKKFDELNRISAAFTGMVNRMKNVLHANYELSCVYRALGDVFSEIGIRENVAATGEAFSEFGTIHRSMERFSVDMLKKIKPVVSDLNTFLRKVIPDTKLTIKKYLDVKFEYLSYCLKVKEMDDEEYGFAMVQEPLYRVETGNYEYRLILRCRQDARSRFAKMRNDVLIKLELLDNKHVQDTVCQLQRFIDGMATYHDQCYGVMKQVKIFPLEVDISRDAFNYNTGIYNTGEDEDELGELANTSVCESVPTLADEVDLINLSNTISKQTINCAPDGDSFPLDWGSWNKRDNVNQTGESGDVVTDLLCFD